MGGRGAGEKGAVGRENKAFDALLANAMVENIDAKGNDAPTAGYNLSCPTTRSSVLPVGFSAMLIGEAAAAVGVTVKAVRFYAEQGLLGSVPRAGAYRDFQSHHLRRLRIVLHCRSQGFSVEEIREVIALLPDAGCPPPDAMLGIVDAKLADLAEESKRLETQIRRLVETRRYLAGRAEIKVES